MMKRCICLKSTTKGIIQVIGFNKKISTISICEINAHGDEITKKRLHYYYGMCPAPNFATQCCYLTSAVQDCKSLSFADTCLSKTASDITDVRDQEWRSNYNTQFTHTCGELTLNDLGKTVRLCGWVKYRRMDKFIILRDMHGQTQIIIPRDNEEMKQVALNLTLESTIRVGGIVCARPTKNINTKYSTGEIEVSAYSIEIISKATPILPFNITEFNKAREVLLNRYRPLALRFSEYKNNIILYAKMESKMRQFLDKNDFLNIPTPTLFKATPGGAQEFVVPTREKDRYYNLVQSPQQFKQMLMIGGFDRYYQFARCYRDEGTTPERQPEFTQLDIEMSYTTVDGVLKLVEDVLFAAWPTDKATISIPFPRMTYEEVMGSYGTDKPWILGVMKINDLSEFIVPDGNDEDFYGMILVSNSAVTIDFIENNHLSKNDGFKTSISTVQISDEWELTKSELSNRLPAFQAEQLREKHLIRNGDILVISRGVKNHVLADLGSIRKDILTTLVNSKGLNIKSQYEFVWIVDFPLFNRAKNDHCALESTHHPFTQPHPDDIALLHSDPLKVRALHYDLVMNGSEIGGGSIRIHDHSLQSQIFKLLNIPEENFIHLIEAMKYGCPSMGGIALGMERLVMLISKARSIRDVIAFPKGSEGQDVMTDCPCDIPLKDKLLYHLTSAELPHDAARSGKTANN